MTAVFVKILNLSIPASFMILMVIILRFVFAKAPKWIRYILWGTVALRLLIPFSFESSISVIPNAQKIDSTSTSSTSYIAPDSLSLQASQSAPKSPDVMTVLSYVWIAVAILMILYMVISYVRVHLLVREKVKLRDNIYICDHIESPFVLGIIKPKIFLNSAMSESDARYIIEHEQTHIKHHDNIFKPLGFLLLCVYWFNPLCYVAYALFVKDIELFCDESVIKTLSAQGKKEYSTVLLECGLTTHKMSKCPLAFSESNLKQRIKSILKYKKPPLVMVVTSVALCSAVLALFMTNPISSEAKAVQEVVPTQSATQASTEVPTQSPTEEATKAPTEPPTEKPTQPVEISDNYSEAEIDYTEEYTDYSYNNSHYDNGYNNNSEYTDSYAIEHAEESLNQLLEDQNLKHIEEWTETNRSNDSGISSQSYSDAYSNPGEIAWDVSQNPNSLKNPNTLGGALYSEWG